MTRIGVTVAATVAIAACASGRAHQNFKNIMQLDVGKSVDDGYAYRNQYRERRVATKTLPDGTIEEEFITGPGGKCHVFFRLDNQARRIAAWRYEGTEQDCVIRP